MTANNGLPSGMVTVSDGTASCQGSVAAGGCSLTFATAGTKSLVATYAGDGYFNGSASAPVAHRVDERVETGVHLFLPVIEK